MHISKVAIVSTVCAGWVECAGKQGDMGVVMKEDPIWK